MRRYLLFILSLCLLPSLCRAQTDDFDPDTPAEPGQLARVVLTVSPQEAGTVSGAGTYDTGRSVYVSTSRAGAQWKFLRWRNAKTQEVVSTSTGFYLTTTLGTTRLVAEYEQLPIMPLVLQCNPEEVNASLTGSGNYVEGTSVRVSAGTKSGWTFSQWTNKRTGTSVSTSRSFYFTKTAENDTLVANYEYSPQTPGEPAAPVIYRTLTVTVNDTEAGSTSITNQQVKVGDNVSVSAYNKTNYAFLGWQQDGAMVSTSPTYTLTMPNRNVSLVALFEFSPLTPSDPEAAEGQPTGGGSEPDQPDEPQGPSTIRGDVNGDYRVNVIDLTMMIGYILGLEPTPFIVGNADLNGDGRIGIVDVTMLNGIIIAAMLDI